MPEQQPGRTQRVDYDGNVTWHIAECKWPERHCVCNGPCQCWTCTGIPPKGHPLYEKVIKERGDRA